MAVRLVMVSINENSVSRTYPDYDCAAYVEKERLGANAMKRIAAGAHLQKFFEPKNRPDDRADYCLDCSFLSQCKHQVLVFTLEWSGTRPMGEQW